MSRIQKVLGKHLYYTNKARHVRFNSTLKFNNSSLINILFVCNKYLSVLFKALYYSMLLINSYLLLSTPQFTISTN